MGISITHRSRDSSAKFGLAAMVDVEVTLGSALSSLTIWAITRGMPPATRRLRYLLLLSYIFAVDLDVDAEEWKFWMRSSLI